MGTTHKQDVKVTHKFKPHLGEGKVTKQITRQYVIVEWGAPTFGSSMEAMSNLDYKE